ncbi:asparagine synthase-related protein, partial [Klebsiella aerogenes]|uniref:asparagine synthase-related protein n=1 Tax=Klebsiella aerogenes TaxID=548 RepID=UPI0019540157
TPRFDEQARPDFDALREEFRSILRTSVRERLGEDGKTACFLSGGTDSSTVCGLLREATGAAPASYSIGFEAEGYDEMAYARIAAKAYGA